MCKGMAPAVSLFLSFSTPLLAQTSSTTFTDSITVESDFLITVDKLNFGAVDDLSQSVTGSTHGFMTCSVIVPVSSTFATRQMDDGSNTID